MSHRGTRCRILLITFWFLSLIFFCHPLSSIHVGRHVKIEFNEDETEMTWYYEYVDLFNNTYSFIATYERIDELNPRSWDD
ncbi:MAG: hypothetical protein R6V37_05320 [Psychroflexus maritimus]